MFRERPVTRRRHHDHARRPEELERHLRSPIERELGGLCVVAAVRDAEDRHRRLEERRGEGAVGLPLPHLAGRDDGEVAVEVDRVRRHDHSDVGCCGRAAAAELLHRRPEARVKVHVAVRRDAGEDEAHGSEAIRETSRSRKRSASTSTPTSAFGSRPVTPRRSTTVRPSQKSESVSTETFARRVVRSVGSMTWATAIASWIGEPSKPYERSWNVWKKSDSSATKRPAWPAPRRRSAWARVNSAL